MDYSAKEMLEMMLGHLGFTFEVKEEERLNGPTLHVLTRDPGRLIGRNGKTLEDIQFLLNRLLSKSDDEPPKVTVDVENYKLHQYEPLFQKLRLAANKVKESGEAITLDPMNSYDRRIVHNFFKDDADIRSMSPNDKSRLKPITLTKR
ncbi:MAG: R3H domain-containing nucleic acid-binding protein [Verrucomicrobiota bacterium]